MQYQSTRDKNLKASSAQAILNGLAPDGGLYTCLLYTSDAADD